ncbi:hypothetical protein [Pseudomonas turukhanskensis]|uniref:Uncharacterized protein n=1 Tax=Pseudomonas turukhanskensis TaxID=1806536 RepID=A0A9W6NF74_9PSED|nr:hypothetical protein [Pseudomonas turukhanskensis]GLK88525.1 hypothetical protein GCM10017655_15870 [Pseudomonas turukhanskensis]
MQMDFEPRVHVDWKIPGGELLALLQHYYPDIPIFSGAPFEALLDELSNEMAEVCFQALAPLLITHGYDLWNLDAGADDYRPTLIPSDQRQAFAAHWQKPHGGLALTPVRIEPEAPAAPAKPKRKTAKLNWLQEVHDYPAPTYVQAYNYRNGYAAITEQDEDQWLCFLIDFNPWPPTEQDVLEHRPEVDAADLQLIDASPQGSLWKRRVVRGERSGDDRYEYEIRQGNTVQRFGPAGEHWPEFEDPAVVVDGEIFERQRLYEPEQVTRIWRITPTSSEVIFEYAHDLHILPIGAGRLLFMRHNAPQCWIWDRQTPHHTTPTRPLPTHERTLVEATAYLGDDNILLFSETDRQNLEDSAYNEHVLMAWRFNLVTGATGKALLDSLGSEVRQETQIFTNQPKRKITLRTFYGQLHVSKGHGDWWVWNYHTNSFGTQALAWWWNQRSNQVLKLTSRDIPREKPPIYYVPGQDRYLAFAEHFVARLPVFDEMVAAKGEEFLRFE